MQSFHDGPKMVSVCTSNKGVNPRDVPNKKIISSRSLPNDKLMSLIGGLRMTENRSSGINSTSLLSSEPIPHSVINPYGKLDDKVKRFDEGSHELRSSSSNAQVSEARRMMTVDYNDESSGIQIITCTSHKNQFLHNEWRQKKSFSVDEVDPEKVIQISDDPPTIDIRVLEKRPEPDNLPIPNDFAERAKENPEPKNKSVSFNLKSDDVASSEWMQSVLKTISSHRDLENHLASNQVRFRAKHLMRKISNGQNDSLKIFKPIKNDFRNSFSDESDESDDDIPTIQPVKEIPTIKLNFKPPIIKPNSETIITQPHPERKEPIAQPLTSAPETLPSIEQITNRPEHFSELEDCCQFARTTSSNNLRCELRTIVKENNQFYTYVLILNANNQIVSSQKVLLNDLVKTHGPMVMRFVAREFFEMRDRCQQFVEDFYMMGLNVNQTLARKC